MILLFTVALAVLLTYVVVVSVIYGIRSSISDTFYAIRGKFVFQAALGVSSLMGISLIDHLSQYGYEVAGFFVLSGLLLVAVTPNFKEEDQGDVHRSAAIVAALGAALTSVVIDYRWFLLEILLTLPILCLKSRLFWLELMMVIVTAAAYYIDVC